MTTEATQDAGTATNDAGGTQQNDAGQKPAGTEQVTDAAADANQASKCFVITVIQRRHAVTHHRICRPKVEQCS